jgi:hypothetical protein
MKGTTANKARRESAKKMLEAQLLRNTKPEKVNGKTTKNMVALLPTDITRINREIEAINNKKK